MNQSVVIIADICGSRKMKSNERYEGQLLIKSSIVQINEDFKDYIEAPFTITRGDEFQGVVGNLNQAFDIILEFERLLFPLQLRYGLGKGTIQKMGSALPIEMDGPAFHNATSALDEAKRKKNFIQVESGNPCLDVMLNNVLLLMYAIKSRWNQINFQRYWMYKELGTFEKVAQREKVSAQAVWDSMQNMRVQEILQVEKSLRVFLEEHENKLNCDKA
jgi:hypothetical protein